MANPLHLDVDCSTNIVTAQPLSDADYAAHQASQAIITAALNAEAARLAAIEANRVANTYVLARFTSLSSPNPSDTATALNALISLLQITHVLATLPVVSVQQASIQQVRLRRVTRSRSRPFIVRTTSPVSPGRSAPVTRGIPRKAMIRVQPSQRSR